MRRFGTATVLGGLLLLGASWSLSASDTPKTQRHTRRKAVAFKQPSKIDVKLDNLYVDSEIGQVFTVNLGRADQPGSGGETASLDSVQVYQLGGHETEPPTSAEPAEPADDEEAAPAEEMEEAPEAAEPAEAAEALEPAAEPAAAPEAAPPAAQTPPQPDPSAARQPDAKEAPPAAPSHPLRSPSFRRRRRHAAGGKGQWDS